MELNLNIIINIQELFTRWQIISKLISKSKTCKKKYKMIKMSFYLKNKKYKVIHVVKANG